MIYDNYPEGINRFNPPWLDEMESELIEEFNDVLDEIDEDIIKNNLQTNYDTRTITKSTSNGKGYQ